MPDEELMRLVQTGDQRAYARLLDRHLNSVHAYVYRMTNNRADAEDIAQETFLRVWHRARTFRPGRVRFSTWLHRIAHNLCVDAFRKRRTIVDMELEAMADDAPGVDEESIAEQRRKAVHDGIAALPERQRSALVLCQIQGRSNREAAQILDISVDALESLIARARRALKARLSDQLELEGVR
ncbi:MAG: RNA polymerase sigma factor [Gammaproteobacteria bacterium]|nr:RNA polymerase sigma factor [Gammaproteobacteria bacterium]